MAVSKAAKAAGGEEIDPERYDEMERSSQFLEQEELARQKAQSKAPRR